MTLSEILLSSFTEIANYCNKQYEAAFNSDKLVSALSSATIAAGVAYLSSLKGDINGVGFLFIAWVSLVICIFIIVGNWSNYQIFLLHLQSYTANYHLCIATQSSDKVPEDLFNRRDEWKKDFDQVCSDIKKQLKRLMWTEILFTNGLTLSISFVVANRFNTTIAYVMQLIVFLLSIITFNLLNKSASKANKTLQNQLEKQVEKTNISPQ
jgi:uncharacterized membrane protein